MMIDQGLSTYDTGGHHRPHRLKNKLSWSQQLETHTEVKILEALKGKVKPGDIISMQGDLNPRNPGLRGCESFMDQFAKDYGVKIIYRQLGYDTPWVFDGT